MTITDQSYTDLMDKCVGETNSASLRKFWPLINSLLQRLQVGLFAAIAPITAGALRDIQTEL